MTAAKQPLTADQAKLVHEAAQTAARRFFAHLRPYDIDDISHDAVVAVIGFAKRHPDVLTDDERLRAIAWATARRLAWKRAYAEKRSRDEKAAVTIEYLHTSDQPEFAIQEEQRALHRAIAKLSPADKEILGLYCSGHSLRQIAEMLAISHSRAYSRFARSLARLKDMLADEGF